MAENTGFIKRKRKITGSIFLDLPVFNSEALKAQSLNDLSVTLKERHDISIKKQSLQERFDENAVLFLRDVLEKMLRNQIGTEGLLPEKKGFSRILIKDSVCFQIDESLAEEYPGSGGDGSKASVRIQFEYDVLNGRINDLSLNAFNRQDATDSAATAELTEKGDLIIRDLAYMSIPVLKKNIEKESFFLCRLSPAVKVFEKKDGEYTETDFKKLTGYMRKTGLNTMEKEVYIGSTQKLKVRLIMNLLPEEEMQKRLRKANKNSKKKGRKTPGREYKARLSLNLFVTNTQVEAVPAENVQNFYRLRWQIELMFKIWKSLCHIEKVKKVIKHRLECYIYSKIIFIVLCWKIMWKTAQRLYSAESAVLSFYKGFKTLIREKTGQLRDIFLFGIQSPKEFMETFYNLSKTNHLLEKKKQKPTLNEILILCLKN